MIFLAPVGIYLWFKFTKQPNKIIKGIVSAFALMIWVTAVSQQITGYSQTYDINGKSVTVTCEQLCSYVTKYGEDDALKILAGMGITEISEIPYDLSDDKATLVTSDGSAGGPIKVTLEYNEAGKLIKITHAEYTTVVYYSKAGETVAAYPGHVEITKAKEVAEKQRQLEAEKEAAEREAREKAIILENDRAQAEAERKAAEQKAIADKKAAEEKAQQEAAARVPSAGGTAELCERQFHKIYPYSGSKVHSILGVITNSQYSEDSRLYKVEVTIENAYRATYKAVMECVVKKTGDMIQVTSFNIY